MKKTTKLLSVLLSVVMLMSCFTMAAFAAKTNYQSSSNLESLGAYNTKGGATRFTTEERMSITLDWLDTVLENVTFGFDNTNTVEIHVHFNSVDNICASMNSLKSALSSTVISLAKIVGIGDLEDISFSNWPSTQPTRANSTQMRIVGLLLRFLSDNQTVVRTILNRGAVDFGIAKQYIPTGGINKTLGDLTGLLLSKIYPLMSRDDDTVAMQTTYQSGSGLPAATLTTFVSRLFNMPESKTTYKEDASGNCVSDNALTWYENKSTTGTANYKVFRKSTTNGVTTIVPYTYDAKKADFVATKSVFTREAEKDADGNPTGYYIYKDTEGENLKYFKSGSYWLPSFVADGKTININTESAAALLYKFAPYVFKDLAPIALNGFCKQWLATWMGATSTKIYEGDGSDASGVLATLPSAVQSFFTDNDIPYYQFSYSDYLAYSDDVQYYRYIDKDTKTEEWFELDMTTGNYFLGLFDLSYEVGDDFLNEFIPASSSSADDTIFRHLNDFLCKAARTILKSDVYNSLELQTGDNAYLVPNLRKVLQKLLPESPEAILGPDYMHNYAGYYEMLVDTSASDDDVFAALGAIIAKALMPQLILPSAANLAGHKVGAVLACVVRELATQFVPTYNYDALIFTDYNTRTLVNKSDNSYWLDVILTMGVDIGMSYFFNLVDTGDDVTEGFEPEASKTYTLSAFEANPQAWEAYVDWIIDFGLDDSTSREWTWNLSKLITISDVAIGTANDPWAKLDSVVDQLLPKLKELLYAPATTTSKTWLESALRDELILGIANLDFGKIFGDNSQAGLLTVPAGIFRTTGVIPTIWNVLTTLVNNALYKVTGNKTLINTSTYATIDNLVDTKAHFADLAKQLIASLYGTVTDTSNYSTNRLMDVVLPILNMFVGWKTSSQTLADPTFTWSNSDGAGYILTTSSENKLGVRNMSSGMLLKNYKADGSYVYERAYNMVITAISGDNLTFSGQTLPLTVGPYEKKEFTVKATSTPSADQGTQVKVTYYYTGKDGQRIGTTNNYAYAYQVISKNASIITDNKENFEYSSGGVFGLGKTVWVNTDITWKTNYLLTDRSGINDLFSDEIVLNINNNADYKVQFQTCSFTANSSFRTYIGATGQATTSFTIAKGDSKTIAPAKWLKTADDLTTGTAYTIGTMSIGNAYGDGSTKKKDKSTYTPNFGAIYFADMQDLVDLFNSECAANRSDLGYGATEWAAYTTAMKNAAVLVNAPVQSGNFSTRYSSTNIGNVQTALENAIKALEDSAEATTGNVGILETGLANGEQAALIGSDGQINFQDYELYGYWLYEKNRTEARNIIKEYQGPVAPESYIEGCWLPYTDNDKHEDLSTVIAAESNQAKADAIVGTLEAPSAKDVAAYEQALNEYKAPTYTEVYARDIASKLDFYNDFLIPRSYSGNSAGKVQLAQEIAYANAQNYVQADYTETSWARYADALAAAQAANNDASTKQSDVFQAKYDLLKAQRQLLLKANDYATQVGFTDLQALVDLAEGMFANSAYFTAVDGTLDTEWSDLIEALGYTADFGTWSMNLYENSATKLINDEVYYPSVRNEQRVADTAEALQAAIDALKCTIEVVKNDATTVVNQEIKFITNIAPLSVASVDDILTHVKASSEAADLAVTATANGYGTGTTVAVSLNGMSLANYYVVIYGDIDGDTAIDGFDASKADVKLTDGATLAAPQEKAADATKDGSFSVEDVSAIIAAASNEVAINQA